MMDVQYLITVIFADFACLEYNLCFAEYADCLLCTSTHTHRYHVLIFFKILVVICFYFKCLIHRHIIIYFLFSSYYIFVYEIYTYYWTIL